jgi:hypothetical protein
VVLLGNGCYGMIVSFYISVNIGIIKVFVCPVHSISPTYHKLVTSRRTLERYNFMHHFVTIPAISMLMLVFPNKSH